MLAAAAARATDAPERTALMNCARCSLVIMHGQGRPLSERAQGRRERAAPGGGTVRLASRGDATGWTAARAACGLPGQDGSAARLHMMGSAVTPARHCHGAVTPAPIILSPMAWLRRLHLSHLHTSIAQLDGGFLVYAPD